MATRGKKRVSMKMVAEKAGLSISAVSMALSDSTQISDTTKQRIRQICRELGYPLDRRSANRLAALGRVGFLAVGDSVKDESLSGLTRVLTLQTSSRNIRLEVSAYRDPDDSAGCVEHIKAFAQNLDGLLISGMLNPTVYAYLCQMKVPHVVIGHATGNGYTSESQYDVRAIWSDELTMGATAVRHLHSRGHTRLGFICYRMLRGLWASRWLDGVRLAMLDSGATTDDLCLQVIGETANGPEAVATAIAGLKEPLDGLILPDLHVAPRILAELRKQGVELPPSSVILGGNPAMAEQYGMGEYPIITEDGETIVAVALDLLASSSRNSPFNRVNLVVPFMTRNLNA